MEKYQFIDQNGTFEIKNADQHTYLYLPLAGEEGLKSAITPTLGGDSKLDQGRFLLEPVSVENLHNNRSTRNFWCRVEGKGCWSATGQSAEAEFKRFMDQAEENQLTAGFMWQKVERTSKHYQLRSEITSFVPVKENAEVMLVKITNTASESQTITPVAAVPIYGRGADNIRDHRHVTALFHRIYTRKYGVYVTPVLAFDERGHRKNNTTFYVCGISGEGVKPRDFYPVTENFIGEGGTFTAPGAVRKDLEGAPAGEFYEGKEAMGALRFEQVTVEPGQTISYTVFIGATDLDEEIAALVEKYGTTEAVEQELEETKKYWQERVNVAYHTKDAEFDNYLKWVSFQPMLRRIYGCSFLPYHDYGKGGRGWRDLWQDCLALLIMNPDGVRQMILDNYGGVRMDGTNATIIGEHQGEFVADRNNITRVWMDHGVWPFMTTKLYMDQTGDIRILLEDLPYFKDRQVERGTQTDEEWNEFYGCSQKTKSGNIYQGTVLEHLLLQHLCSFYEVGEHNHLLLRGADWNDAIDMAKDRGESVAFTNAYAGNMRQLADYIEKLAKITEDDTVELAEEIGILLCDEWEIYQQPLRKKQLLDTYVKLTRHNVCGRKSCFSVEEICKSLRNKADWIMDHIRKSEWVTDEKGNGWFNGYYDNNGRRVEGEQEGGARMMLTSQVFAVMSETATKEQVKAITASADAYLYDRSIGGYRLNTNFRELKTDLGRMFGFAYGEKENGAVFSHMTVMYAKALYQRGFVKEGYKALQTLADAALNFETSGIFPGIPEYFNGEGKGMYHYLTGAASWYMLTMITEVFGVRGELGDLVLEPKLMKQQFDQEGKASIELPFAGKKIQVVYHNPEHLGAKKYRIAQVMADGTAVENAGTESTGKYRIAREFFKNMSKESCVIEVELA